MANKAAHSSFFSRYFCFHLVTRYISNEEKKGKVNCELRSNPQIRPFSVAAARCQFTCFRDLRHYQSFDIENINKLLLKMPSIYHYIEIVSSTQRTHNHYRYNLSIYFGYCSIFTEIYLSIFIGMETV